MTVAVTVTVYMAVSVSLLLLMARSSPPPPRSTVLTQVEGCVRLSLQGSLQQVQGMLRRLHIYTSTAQHSRYTCIHTKTTRRLRVTTGETQTDLPRKIINMNSPPVQHLPDKSPSSLMHQSSETFPIFQ